MLCDDVNDRIQSCDVSVVMGDVRGARANTSIIGNNSEIKRWPISFMQLHDHYISVYVHDPMN